ncbi:phage tail protein [Paenibacillus motobuensis]|uniref:tail fiber protein n=1 Tax=Paenibacillus TaxID=44249 RepID=UPI00203D04B9|nr:MULTISPECIES: phage tail protein [Paenibacillus]MCM3040735.1 phage tail protein [Paenibacillus lutimineralis]MCM3647839.1 phage tail protein [Paenibacillus motobuensis]
MAKTDWRLTDVVKPEDMNNLGQEINDLRSDLSNIDVPPATLTKPGIVQLSSATDSEVEDRAATSKAVKEAYDRGSKGIDAATNAKAATDVLAGTVATQLAQKAPLSNPGFTGTAWVNGNEALHKGNMKSILEIDPTTNLVQVTVGMGKQFATIQAALDSLKKFNAGPRQIRVSPGHVEPNMISIVGFIGGSITIQSDTFDNFTVQNTVYLNNNTATIYLDYITIEGGNIQAQNCNSLFLSGVTQRSGTGLNVSNSSLIYVNYCEFSNLFRALTFNSVALATLMGVKGTGNTTGIISGGSIVMLGNQTTITGTTPQEKYGGGQIFG